MSRADLEERFAFSEEERNIELQLFREKWKQELNANVGDLSVPQRQDQDPNAGGNDGARSKFDIAAEIFREGIKEERNGRVYEAVSLYRHAIQLDPDIEFKTEKQKTKPRNRDENGRQVPNEAGQEGIVEETEEEILERLMAYNVYRNGTCLFEMDHFPASHISSLPFEVLQYVTQWVVSTDLDFISLEQFSRVCHGFYRTSRESNIWRLACLRIWGTICGRPEDFHYGSWREMVIFRPQIRFNGVYISRISYIRPGEASFIDQNTHYRAWQTVCYYRFFRFFSDGTVLYANTPDEPVAVVPRLRAKQGRDPLSQILVGHFHLTADGDGVVLYLKRNIWRDDGGFRSNRYRREKKKEGSETLVMELLIRNSRERLHARLDWRRYSITRTTGKLESHNVVDVSQHFPSCYFSRVKSYSNYAELPLL